MVRNESIDTLKGLLIILVIIGHVLLGTLDENVFRYVIYSFHMPVFLFISGYLINIQKLQDLSPKELLAKYWKRMLLPWLFALFLYSLALSVSHFTPIEFASRLLHPYYHLWYVPTLFVFIILVWMISHIKERILSIILAITLGLMFFNMPVGAESIRMGFFIYFIMGVIAKNIALKVESSGSLGGGIFLLFIIGVTLLSVYGVGFKIYGNKLQLPLMVIICLISVLPIILRGKFSMALLSYIGVHSLEIYLWHVFPIMVLKHLFKDSDTQYLYYSLAFGMTLIMLIAIQIKTKYSIVKQ
jgi:fucose 4-O-acetylase-like acetyltransferase